MTEGISQSRMLLYIMIACFLPVVYACWSYQSATEKNKRLLIRLEMVQESTIMQQQKLAPNRAVQNVFQNSDRNYLDKYVENIALLKGEIEFLEQLLNTSIVAPDPKVVSRLDALKKNSIQFSEGTVEAYAFFKDSPDVLAKPVEVSSSDLQQVLSRLEGIPMGGFEPGPNRPQMLLTDFKFERKSGAQQGSLYSLNVKLIKREFL